MLEWRSQMKKQIIPSLIAKNKKELDKRFDKVKPHSKVFQLDIMDGKFVKNKSLMFDFSLPKGKKYEAHLMVKNPESWISRNWKKADLIIFHIESLKSNSKVREIIKLIKLKRKKIGIALNPTTKVKRIIPYLNSINMILVMTVIPGRYGSKFLPNTLKKVKEIRKLKPKLNIEVDGGINDKTISKTKKAGATSFIVGSYLQKSEDVKTSFKFLEDKLK